MEKNNKGFSLVELIIVIAIMAVLIGLLAPQYLRFVQKSKVSADLSNAQSIATAFNVLFAEGGCTSTDNYDGKKADAGITADPVIKAVKNGTWSIAIGADGVTEVAITADSTKHVVWPNVASTDTVYYQD